MKKILLTTLTACFCIAVYAQGGPGKKPAASGPIIKTLSDSVSYALGVNIARNLAAQGLDKVSLELLKKGMNDQLTGKPLLIKDQEANQVISSYMQKAKMEKITKNKKAGEAFLARNKTRAGVTTLPSGLQYEVITTGNGATPGPGDRVKCHYTGTLIDGTEFDGSVGRGEPAVFSVGGVISGWTEALQLMKAGSKWRLFIPSGLAYGDVQAGPKIPPASTLIFELELLEVIPAGK